MTDDDDPGDILLPGETESDIYKGKRTTCNHCGKEFTWGQEVMFCAEKDLVFCAKELNGPEDVEKNCMLMWVVSHPVSVRCLLMKFQGD